MAATSGPEFDLYLSIPGISGLRHILNRLLGRLDDMAVDQAGLDAKIADLKASVDALVAIVQAPPAPAAVDLQAEADSVDAIKSEVDAAVAAAQPATPAA